MLSQILLKVSKFHIKGRRKRMTEIQLNVLNGNGYRRETETTNIVELLF